MLQHVAYRKIPFERSHAIAVDIGLTASNASDSNSTNYTICICTNTSTTIDTSRNSNSTIRSSCIGQQMNVFRRDIHTVLHDLVIMVEVVDDITSANHSFIHSHYSHSLYVIPVVINRHEPSLLVQRNDLNELFGALKCHHGRCFLISRFPKIDIVGAIAGDRISIKNCFLSER
jgi:hypothetical protein